MINEILLTSVVIISSLGNISQSTIQTPSASLVAQREILAEHALDLNSRLPDKVGSEVFADNILLTLHYLKGDVGGIKVNQGELGGVDWRKARESFEASFILEPGEVFAYHDTVSPEFKNEKIKTSNAHFTLKEGYKPLAGLPGNGVCHLASLINWVASDAGLGVMARVNHDFFPVPGVPKENGTSIRWGPNGEFNSRNQNLYIKNNFDFPVIFEFIANEEMVILKILK